MSEAFDFSELAAEVEERLDQPVVPPHFGEELVLAEGETYQGRYRGRDLDPNVDREVFLLVDVDTGVLRFIRERTSLVAEIEKVNATKGDYIVIGRGQDGEAKKADWNPPQRYRVAVRASTSPLPGASAPEEEAELGDIPF